MAGWLWNLRPRRKPADSDAVEAACGEQRHLLRQRRVTTQHASGSANSDPTGASSQGYHNHDLTAKQIRVAGHRAGNLTTRNERPDRPWAHSPLAGRGHAGSIRSPGPRLWPGTLHNSTRSRRQRASTGHPDPRTAQTHPTTPPTSEGAGLGNVTSTWTRSHRSQSPLPWRPGPTRPLPRARSLEPARLGISAWCPAAPGLEWLS